jgi:hypothetical protein
MERSKVETENFIRRLEKRIGSAKVAFGANDQLDLI